jgi:hypothetical protein
LAAQRGLERLEAGVNLGRGEAYRAILRHGFRVNHFGLAMPRFDSPSYNRPDVHATDDWR